MEIQAYPNLQLINNSIRLLYKSLKPARVRTFSNHQLYYDTRAISWSDPIIATQQLARIIALHYQLPVATVIVYFSSNLPVPGRVEISNTNDYYIEIQEDLREKQGWVAAILAHEIAHIFLHKQKIWLETEFNNEVLTDTTAAFLGCGALILNAASETSEHIDSISVRITTRHFGYLTLEEFGYVLAKRDLFFGFSSWKQIESGIPRDGFSAGNNRLRAENEQTPFMPRPLSERLIRTLLQRFGRIGPVSSNSNFGCPCCAQILRVPQYSRTIRIRCPNCEAMFNCYP